MSGVCDFSENLHIQVHVPFEFYLKKNVQPQTHILVLLNESFEFQRIVPISNLLDPDFTLETQKFQKNVSAITVLLLRIQNPKNLLETNRSQVESVTYEVI